MSQITIDQVEQAIQKLYPHVGLWYDSDHNYFFIYSDHPVIGLWVAGLYQASIYVADLDYMTVEQWVESVRMLFDDPRNDQHDWKSIL